MSFTDSNANATPPLPLGIGATMVAPHALIGTAMIADYPGPDSFTEFFGWWALCLAVAAIAASLLRRFHQGGRLRFIFLLLGMAVPVALGVLLYADIHPDTPLAVKAAVERSLQIIGVPAVGAPAIFIGWIGWNSRRAR